MPTVDIRFKHTGFLSEYITFRNIEEYQVAYIDDICKITFYKTNKKGIKRHYEFQIPKHNLVGLHIRRTLENE